MDARNPNPIRKIFPSAGLLLGLALLLVLGAAACSQHTRQNPVRIKVVMKKYSFEPPVIRVRQGDWVALEVSTPDVQHGFYAPDFKLRQPVQPGRPVTITFHAEQRGVYPIQCSIVCGPGHDDMAGSIVVE